MTLEQAGDVSRLVYLIQVRYLGAVKVSFPMDVTRTTLLHRRHPME